MTRLRVTLTLAAAIGALAAAPAGAYQHLGEQVGSQVLSEHWASLPITLTVDNGPTNVLGEVATATATWNAVPTAKDPWAPPAPAVDGSGQPVDFTGANFGTAWGDLNGDGRQEVVFDEDGSALRALGLDPASVNGFGPSAGQIRNGEAELEDMYLVVNGTRTNFDRQSTEVHELGHTLGLAHSSVGFAVGKNGALSAELESQVPTMHPFSIVGTDRSTLEADDVASLSELYPEPSFASSTGTITGTVTRCGTGEPVLGANVRAINVANPTIQLTRVTGFDGATDGSYTIKGVPQGDYDVVVEPLSGDDAYLASLATFTRIDTDFTQEYLNKSKENDCAQDTDPNDKESIPVGASSTQSADLKVEGASLALVVDITGSMGPEIGAIKTGLNDMITALQAVPGSFPKTAIVTFDDAASVNAVSRDPDRLRSVIAGLTTHSTPDCPEGSNTALMTAGRLLGSGGRAILVTDAESHPTGPTRQDVDELYASKGARLSVLLSGSCPPPPAGAAARGAARPAATGAGDASPSLEAFVGGGTGPDQAKPVDVLGAENSVRTFSEESLFSGGLFSFQPEIKSGTADANARYSNTLANIAISAVLPAVAAVSPSAVPRGTTLDVELTGSKTGFRAGSTVAIAGAGVSVASADVLSPTRIVMRLTVAPDAATGFRDVTVSTDRGDGSIETAKGIGAVQVVAAPTTPTVLSVTPSTVAVGTARDVTISGALTNFGASSIANLGAGVTVSSVTASSPTSAVAHVTVAPGAAVGFRDVTVQTGAEIARETVTGPFLVTAAPPAIPRLTSATPSSGVRGSTVDVVLTGADTAFASGTSLASVSGAGVQVLATTVSSPTAVVARLRIAGDAPLGFRDLKVTTAAQNAALLDGFEVRAVPGATASTPAPAAGAASSSAAPSTCSDRSRPSAALLKGKQGARAKRGRLSLHGRASDRGCVAAISVTGRVARVEVAISRKAGKRCRFVAASGKLTSARSCSKPVWLKAKGTTQWSLTTKRALPHGAYTIQVRARDAAGNRQAKAVRRTQRVA
jgi:hypothetical protein